jgi:hypothetical protein
LGRWQQVPGLGGRISGHRRSETSIDRVLRPRGMVSAGQREHLFDSDVM